MTEEERKGLTIRGKALRANIAKQDEDAVIPSTAHSKIVGGRCTHTDCVMDSGCSFPITSTAVAEALGAEVKPLTRKLTNPKSKSKVQVQVQTDDWVFIKIGFSNHPPQPASHPHPQPASHPGKFQRSKIQ